MKIENVPITRAGVKYSKLNSANQKENNNISFTGLNLKNKFIISLPLILASFGISQNANAKKTLNNSTESEIISKKYEILQQNTNNWNMQNNIIITELPLNVQQFIIENKINTDGDSELNEQEYKQLTNVAMDKAYNYILTPSYFKTQTDGVLYSNNINDLVSSANKIMYDQENDDKLFDNYQKTMNTILETLDKKDNMVLDKNVQKIKMDELYTMVENGCDEYSRDMKAKCIALDEAVYQAALSLQNPNSPSIKREDYNYSLNYYEENLRNRIDSYKSTFQARIEDMKDDVDGEYYNISLGRITDLIKYTDSFNKSMQENYKSLLQNNPELIKVQQQYENTSNLSAEQSRKNANLSNLIKASEKENSEYNSYIQSFKTPLVNQRDQLVIYTYNPNSSVESIYTELEKNYADFASRYDKAAGALEQFDSEKFESLNTILQRVNADKYTELNRYRNVLNQVKDIVYYVKTNSSTKNDIFLSNDILQLLTNAQEANDKAINRLRNDVLNALVTAVEIAPPVIDDEQPDVIDNPDNPNEPGSDVPDPTTVNLANYTVKTPNLKSMKLFKDGRIVIAKPVEISKGKFAVKLQNLDGRLIGIDKNIEAYPVFFK